ncbi:ComF family protein [Geothrix sp. 21YS21S-4]|uniref:ComF family protein n=1 Tax=Geothrix sp. 21YS21S-4 TaxID=3068889 RepID=UPI0027BA6F4D|nr:phosphoribosyltransferase family protein [Geothrix sp. 21YS21S-4]
MSRLLRARADLVPCRGCLAPVGSGAEAGLCASCWDGLLPLSEVRCPRCALVHGEGPCPEPVEWDLGDALWDYRGGRPSLGPLLVPGVKRGERGWQAALLRRLARADLPRWVEDVDEVTSAPSGLVHRLARGIDFGAEAGRAVAARIARPWRSLLTKGWTVGRQAVRTESQRRRLPRKAVALRSGAAPSGIVLLVDDVWTTGTTLLRCAQALKEGGAAEVRVLALFRAL